MFNTLHCLIGFLINSNFYSVKDPEIFLWKPENYDQILTSLWASPAEFTGENKIVPVWTNRTFPGYGTATVPPKWPKLPKM